MGKMMKTSELAKRADVTAETVRYYTRLGLISASRDPANNYKDYDSQALQRLRFIHQAREIGFSLKEVQSILALANEGDTPCPTVRQLLQEKIQQTEQRLLKTQQQLAMLRDTYKQWQCHPDKLPTEQSICALIESWSAKEKDNE